MVIIKAIISVVVFVYTLLPLRPPGLLMLSCGIGVTSSIDITCSPALAIAFIAAAAAAEFMLGDLFPPLPLSFIMTFDIPTSSALCAACLPTSIATHGVGSSLDASANNPPDARATVIAPVVSVMVNNVLFLWQNRYAIPIFSGSFLGLVSLVFPEDVLFAPLLDINITYFDLT